MPSPDGPAAPTELADLWNRTVTDLIGAGALVAMVRELAWKAGLQRIDDRQSPPLWVLTVELEPLRNPSLVEKLAAVLFTALGHPLQLELQPGSPADSPALRDAAERARRQAVAEETIHSDPVVKALLAQYKTARVVPGSVKPT